jgi:short-subunit dehydrogenase
MDRFKGQTALITGASSGLGADFARQLADAGCHLVLVARRLERLEALAEEISRTSPVKIDLVGTDLLKDDAVKDLHVQITARHDIDILINNAGFGLFGGLFERPWDRQKDMLMLNVVVMAELTRLFAHDMAARGHGDVLLVGSLAGFQPVPLFAAYSASKAFVLSFGIALHEELKALGVNCTVLSPGSTETEFHDVAGMRHGRAQQNIIMPSAEVAALGLEALANRRAGVVAGTRNKLIALASRFVPRAFVARGAMKLMRKQGQGDDA